MKHILCSLRSALFGCTLALSSALALAATARADSAATAPAAAASNSQASGPLVATFDKAVDADKGPYVLMLKNNGDHTLKVTAEIHSSVVAHNDSKDKTNKHSIKAGQSWTVTNLAAGDKITVTADGVTPLELAVP